MVGVAIHYNPVFPPIEVTYQSFCNYYRHENQAEPPSEEWWISHKDIQDYAGFTDAAD